MRDDARRFTHWRFASIIAVLLAAGPAAAQTEAQARRYGALAGTHLAMDCRGVPARDAIRAVARAIDVTIVVHARHTPEERGLDGDAPVTISTPGAPARVILESILDQAAEYEPVTWQLRDEWIEVGTKRDLAARRAFERRFVDPGEFAIDPPYFSTTPMPSTKEFEANPYNVAALSRPTDDGRKDRAEVVAEMVRMFVETIDPGNWNYGQYDGGRFGDLSDALRRELRGRRIARISIARGQFMITAPEFIHRAMMGPPRPILPRRLDRDAREQRRHDASTDDVRVWIVDDLGVPQEARDEWSWAQRPRQALRAAFTDAKVTLVLDGVPAREAFAALSAQLPFPLKPRWNDDRLGFGMDPDRRVSLEAGPARRTARAVLEEILLQLGDPDDPGRWQARDGYIEAGTRSRLSVPAAARTELHYVADLVIHIPADPSDRRFREEIALELVEKIVTTIEPELWDWGQLPETIDEDLQPRAEARGDRDARPGGQGRPPARSPRVVPKWVAPQRPAIIRYWRDYMIVHAPGYLHRQIGAPVSERGEVR